MSRPTSELAHLFRALKAPAAARALPKLADRAREEEWSFEQFAATLLKTEIDSRDSHGGQAPIKAARFPAPKTIEEFNFAFQTSLRRDTVLHLAQLDFLAGRENIVLLGPPGTGKSHLAIALGMRACLAGHRVAFRTATEWVALLADAQRHGRLDTELDRLARIPLLICDEVGYIPFDPQAANLMFMLVSRRYERASLIVTSNKAFSAWGEIFGDEVTATAMIDRLVHHAEILSLKGDSYRLKDRDLARPRPAGQKLRNGLTGHPRTPPRGPPNAFTRRGPRRERAKTTSRDGAPAASAAPARPPVSPPRHPPRPTKGVNFRPAPKGQLSTGLDMRPPRPLPLLLSAVLTHRVISQRIAAITDAALTGDRAFSGLPVRSSRGLQRCQPMLCSARMALRNSVCCPAAGEGDALIGHVEARCTERALAEVPDVGLDRDDVLRSDRLGAGHEVVGVVIERLARPLGIGL